MTSERRPDVDTATRILDSAERLAQARGFNGFSYADIAAELELTKASLHYHFRGKAELGEALVERYRTTFRDALAALDDSDADARTKLDGYASLYAAVLRRKRMCLCGMLAAEFETLPSTMQAGVLRFFDENEQWLARVLADGRRAGGLSFRGDPGDVARMLVSGLEGAMLVARPYGDVQRFEASAGRLLDAIVGPPAP
jgi:TetR/AcrR family transcriptional repressor of nem operon